MTTRRFAAIGLSLLYLAIASFAGELPKKVELTKEQLYDKIRGGWVGKFIGCTYGGPTEFKYSYKMIPDDKKINWQHGAKIGRKGGEFGGLYDDLYMGITFMSVYEKLGLNAPRKEFKRAVAEANFPLWCANLKARINYFDGNIDQNAPTSWRDNGRTDDIDFQIESDYAGLMSPANVKNALKFAEVAGRAFNASDGYYCGAYVATMCSLAFALDNPQDVVEYASRILPKESITYAIVSDIIAHYKENKTDWKLAWKTFHDKYTPQRKGSIYAPYNLAYVVIGLLYGNGDFDKTADISTRCGLDSDCNPSTACGILAIISGYSNIPQKWQKYIEPLEKTYFFKGTNYTLEKTYSTGYMHALSVLKSNGVNINNEKLSIDVVLPDALPYEKNGFEFGTVERPRIPKAFEKFIESGAIVGYLNISKENLPAITKENPVVEIEFEGTGIAIYNTDTPAHNKNMSNKKHIKGNCATVEVFLDGKKQIDANYSFEEHRYRRNWLYEVYDLPHGKHKVKLVLKNAHEQFPPLHQTVATFKNLK